VVGYAGGAAENLQSNLYWDSSEPREALISDVVHKNNTMPTLMRECCLLP
jgi:hypothetical protein